MMISGRVVRLWRTSIKESNVTAHKERTNYCVTVRISIIQAERIARRNWILAVRLDVNTWTRVGGQRHREFFECPDHETVRNILTRSLLLNFSISSLEHGEIYSSEYLCETRDIYALYSEHCRTEEPFCIPFLTSTSVIRRMFHWPFWYLYLFYFFFSFFANSSAHWKNSRATIILVFTIEQRILRGNGGNTWKEIEFVKEMNPRNN